MELTEPSLERAKLLFWLWGWSRLWFRFWFSDRCWFDDGRRRWYWFFVDWFGFENWSWLWLISRDRFFERLSLIGFGLVWTKVRCFENRDFFLFWLLHWLLICRGWLRDDFFFEGRSDFLFFDWLLNYIRSDKRSGFCRLFFRFWHDSGRFDAL